MTRLLTFCLAVFLALAAAAEDKGAPVGLNLAPVTDWSTQAPFLDVMKTARPWIVHRRGQWGGGGEGELIEGGFLDDHGWPKRLPRELGTIGTVILTDIPAQARSLAGTYRLRFDGKGIVEVSGRAEKVRYSEGDVLFEFTPGPGPVEIRIQGSTPDDYVRNITVVKEAHRAAFDSGALFNPDWLALLDGFTVLRFMDWMAANNSRIRSWQDRPLPRDYTYARNGVPVEVMLALLHETGADGWVTLPHMADDEFITNFASAIRQGAPKTATIYAEFSNEVWNWQFEQTRWADEQAQARWNQPETGLQFYGMRAAQMAQILREELGNEEVGDTATLINVISTQTGWLGLERLILEAPLWQAEADSPGNPPWVYFDAYAVTGYFGGILGVEDRAPLTREWITESRATAEADAQSKGLTGDARDAYLQAHQYDLASARAGAELMDGSLSGDPLDTLDDLLGRVLPHHAQVAKEYGLELIVYEGGSHVLGIGALVDDESLTEFFTHFNYTPEMGALYTRLLDDWRALGGGVFTAYSDVYAPSKWGSWGALRWLGDDNARWQALKCGGSCD